MEAKNERTRSALGEGERTADDAGSEESEITGARKQLAERGGEAEAKEKGRGP